MKQLLIGFCLLLICLSMTVYSFNNNLEFKTFKNTSNSSLNNINTREIDGAVKVKRDKFGNWYVLGFSYGNFDQLPNQGFADIFVIKLNQYQQKLFTLSIGSQCSDMPVDLVVDSNMDIYILGQSDVMISDRDKPQHFSYLLKIISDGITLSSHIFNDDLVLQPNLLTIDNSDRIYISCVKVFKRSKYKSESGTIIRKYNSQLGLDWEKPIIVYSENIPTSLVVYNNNLYLTGLYIIENDQGGMYKNQIIQCHSYINKISLDKGEVYWSKDVKVKTHNNRLLINDNKLEIFIEEGICYSGSFIYNLFKIYRSIHDNVNWNIPLNCSVWSVQENGQIHTKKIDHFNQGLRFTTITVNHNQYYILYNHKNEIQLKKIVPNTKESKIFEFGYGDMGKAFDIHVDDNNNFLVAGYCYGPPGKNFYGGTDAYIKTGKVNELSQKLIKIEPDKIDLAKNIITVQEQGAGIFHIYECNVLLDFALSQDNEIYLLGTRPYNKIYFSKLDSNFNLLWEKPLPEIESIKFIENINGEIYLVSVPKNKIPELNTYEVGGLLSKYNKKDELEWQQEFGKGNINFQRNSFQLYDVKISTHQTLYVLTVDDKKRNFLDAQIWEFEQSQINNKIQITGIDFKSIDRNHFNVVFTPLQSDTFVLANESTFAIIDKNGKPRKQIPSFKEYGHVRIPIEIAIDKKENIYLLISNDNTSILCKYSPKLELIWKIYLGVEGVFKLTDMVLDFQDNIYLTGTSRNLREYIGFQSLFTILKFNGDGQLIWSKLMEAFYHPYSGTGYETGRIRLDQKGNIYSLIGSQLVIMAEDGGILTIDQPQEKIVIETLNIKSLLTSSALTESNDKNAYHPIKVFDNDPKTMWIEDAEGFGKGEWLEIILKDPVQIDRIEIQPGCFWDIYWQKNYRLKKAELWLNDQSFEVRLEDIMKDQGIEFKKTMVFSRFKIIIQEVYPTTKWDDTALSGIKFYYKDKKLKVNLGSYEKFLGRDK